ncbi:Cyanophycin synthetase [compost metagenome]
MTNIQEDHLGIADIHDLDDLTRVKSVIIGAVKRTGWAVLNADNAYCLKIAEDASCNIAYFSMNEKNPALKEHSKAGGIAAIYENGFITIKKGDWKIRVEKVTQVPLTFNGSVDFMIQNVLAATLTAFLQGYKTEDIRMSLQTFIPSAAQTPGRMNIFKFKDFKVMVDFAHNPDGFNGIKGYLQTIEASQHIGIISATGDRRDEDIIETARIAAQMFDKVIICQEKYLRGRPQQELIDLLISGLVEVKPGIIIEVNNNGDDCLKKVIKTADFGVFITILSNTIDDAVHKVANFLDQEISKK